MQITFTDFHFIGASYNYLNAQISLLRNPVYGPIALNAYEVNSAQFYDFSKVVHSFDRKLSVPRLSSIHSDLLKDIILSNVSTSIGQRMRPYIDTVFKYSEKNQLDPIWVLSVIWVESHFKPQALSHVGAAGLMQIMPKTGVFLNGLLKTKLPLKVSNAISYDPVRNIELGSMYLKKLLKRFSGNYTHATVAYNMGPSYTMRRLRAAKPVGERNRYLDKVNRAYSRLSKPLRSYLQFQTEIKNLEINHFATR